MSRQSNIGTRMKGYEQIVQARLIRRMPVVIRLDGRNFHTFTQGMKKPFDDILIKSMQDTMKYLCKNIQGCVLGYTQSDEITLILVDYKELNSSAWFDNKIQKICSVSASMATMAFNKFFWNNVQEKDNHFCFQEMRNEETVAYLTALCKAREKGAMFDSRCFNIPKEEVTNLIYWRQLDATRNSIQMVGQANFSHNELQGKSCNEIQDMLFTQKGINWNDLPTTYKRGSCCVKNTYPHKGFVQFIYGKCLEDCTIRDPKQPEKAWIIDNEIPIFTGEGREYIDILVDV